MVGSRPVFANRLSKFGPFVTAIARRRQAEAALRRRLVRPLMASASPGVGAIGEQFCEKRKLTEQRGQQPDAAIATDLQGDRQCLATRVRAARAARYIYGLKPDDV